MVEREPTELPEGLTSESGTVLFDVFKVRVGRLKNECVTSSLGNKKNVRSAALQLAFSLSRTKRIEILAMAVPQPGAGNLSKADSDPSLTHFGSFMIQIVSPLKARALVHDRIDSGSQNQESLSRAEGCPPTHHSSLLNPRQQTPLFVTFILAVSGSVGESAWANLLSAIVEAISTILRSEVDYVNVILCGQKLTTFSPTPQIASGRTKVKVNHFLRSLQLESSSPTSTVREALKFTAKSIQKAENSHPIVYFVSDGTVSDEVAISSFVAEKVIGSGITHASDVSGSHAANPRPVRILTLGIGHNVNKYFLQFLARSTCGTFARAPASNEGETSNISAVVLEQLRSFCSERADVPCLSNIRVMCSLEEVDACDVPACDSSSSEAAHSSTKFVDTLDTPLVSSVSSSDDDSAANAKFECSSERERSFLHSWPAVSGSQLNSSMPDLRYHQELRIIGTYRSSSRERLRVRFPKNVTIIGVLADGTPFHETVPVAVNHGLPLSSILATSLVDAQISTLFGLYGIQGGKEEPCQAYHLRRQLLHLSIRESIETPLTAMVCFEANLGEGVSHQSDDSFRTVLRNASNQRVHQLHLAMRQKSSNQSQSSGSSAPEQSNCSHLTSASSTRQPGPERPRTENSLLNYPENLQSHDLPMGQVYSRTLYAANLHAFTEALSVDSHFARSWTVLPSAIPSAGSLSSVVFSPASVSDCGFCDCFKCSDCGLSNPCFPCKLCLEQFSHSLHCIVAALTKALHC